MGRMFFSVTLLLVTIGSTDTTNYDDYIRLIKNVYNYYGTTCIVFVHSSNYTDLKSLTHLHLWTKESSHHDTMSTSMTFSELSFYANEYQSRIWRPLFIPILTTKESMTEFSETTKQISISFPVWFVMFVESPGNPLKDFCLNPTWNVFHVRFNTEMLVLCYDDPVLKEWYAISDNRIRTYNLATWEPGEAMKRKTNQSLYARRNNMFGELFRISMVQESSFVNVKDGVLTSFFGDLIMELSKTMNFTIKLMRPVENYGSWDEERKVWSGVIGQLNSKAADFGVSDITMTSTRMDVVDFTLPLIFSRNRFYFREPDISAVQWEGYIKAFDMNIWGIIFFIFLSMPILLTLMKTKGYMVLRIVMENYINLWGIYCQQSLPEFPNETSMRIAFLTLFLCALVVSSAYSASLISFLTVSSASLPFSNIVEFASDRSYDLIVFKNSADYDSIENAKDSITLKLKEKMKMKQELPLTLKEGLDMICNEKVVFFTTELIVASINFRLPCEITYIEAGSMDSLGLTLTKNNQFTGLMNYNLQRFKNYGVFNKIKAMHLRITVAEDCGYAAVGFWGVVPLLVVLSGGIILGCSFLMLERMCFQLMKNKSINIQCFKNYPKFLGKKLAKALTKAGKKIYKHRLLSDFRQREPATRY